jgi:hypothetical protein
MDYQAAIELGRVGGPVPGSVTCGALLEQAALVIFPDLDIFPAVQPDPDPTVPDFHPAGPGPGLEMDHPAARPYGDHDYHVRFHCLPPYAPGAGRSGPWSSVELTHRLVHPPPAPDPPFQLDQLIVPAALATVPVRFLVRLVQAVL